MNGDPLNNVDPMGLNKCEVGLKPLRWGGNAVDCASKVEAADVLEAGANAVAPGAGTHMRHSPTTVCLSGTAGWGVGSLSSVCIGQSHLSEFGVTLTNGGGVETPNVGFSLEGNISNARRLCDLGGLFGYAGGSVGPLSGDVSAGPSADGPVVVAGGGVGIGLRPAEGHSGVSRTKVWSFSL